MFMRLYFLLLFTFPCAAAELPGIPLFIDEMVSKHEFEREKLVKIFERAQHVPAVINAISLPSTIKPWTEYRANFINDKRITAGLKFWQLHEETLKRAEWEYGVPQEIIVAIIGVETMYGRNSGRFSALNALTTLAFDYPPREVFFRSELENYLVLAHEQNWDIFTVKSSYAGALGIPQFMPSSYLKHAEDYDNDNLTDLIDSPVDAIGSVGNYLKQYGWQKGELVAVPATVSAPFDTTALSTARNLTAWAEMGVIPAASIAVDEMALLLDFTVPTGKEYWLTFNNFKVIRLYNHSNFYSMSIYQLAEELRKGRETLKAGSK